MREIAAGLQSLRIELNPVFRDIEQQCGVGYTRHPHKKCPGSFRLAASFHELLQCSQAVAFIDRRAYFQARLNDLMIFAIERR